TERAHFLFEDPLLARAESAAAISLGPPGDDPSPVAHALEPYALILAMEAHARAAPEHVLATPDRLAHRLWTIGFEPLSHLGAERLAITHSYVSSTFPRWPSCAS